MPDNTEAEKKMIFGLLVEINDKPVTITSANIDFSNIKQNGIEFTLPEQVKLGTLEEGIDGINSILTKFGVDQGLPNADDIQIDWLKNVFKALVSLEIWVDEFHIKIPGSGSELQNKIPGSDSDPQNNDSRYTLRMRAAWAPGNEPETPLPVAIKGIAFGVTNEEETPALPEQPDESQ
ncbi:MAG: hypothetical protein ACMUIU_01845 [bacterium]